MCHPEVPDGQATPDVQREEVAIALPGGEQMPALVAVPDKDPAGGVLVIADIFGRSPFYENLAARLATAGFIAVLPEYFFREGPLAGHDIQAALQRRSKLIETRTLGDFDAAIGWLRDRTGALDGTLTGTVGCCMGGTFVLGLAATRHDVASVCYYGSPAGSKPTEGNLPPALDVLDDIHGPLLGFWGDQDEGVGMSNVEALAAGLTERQVPFEFEVYPGLGHGFLARSNLEPGMEGYDMACDSWTRTVNFYREHLTGVAAV